MNPNKKKLSFANKDPQKTKRRPALRASETRFYQTDKAWGSEDLKRGNHPAARWPDESEVEFEIHFDTEKRKEKKGKKGLKVSLKVRGDDHILLSPKTFF